MDITITDMGATVDFTEEALKYTAGFLASAFMWRDQYVIGLIAGLADATGRLNALEAKGRPERFAESIELLHAEVDGARDALVGVLSRGRVTVALNSAGCLDAALTLTAAAVEAENRYRPVTQLPHPQDRRAA